MNPTLDDLYIGSGRANDEVIDLAIQTNVVIEYVSRPDDVPLSISSQHAHSVLYPYMIEAFHTR